MRPIAVRQNGGTMHARSIALAALAAAVTLTSVASAGPAAAKQRVAINLKIAPQATFVLTPLKSGSLKRDSGRILQIDRVLATPSRTVMRQGQEVTIYYPVIWKLQGKRGTLTIRERADIIDIGSDLNGDGFPDSVGIGTWKVVRGTGQYAKVAGSGRSAQAGLGGSWAARLEGLFTAP